MAKLLMIPNRDHFGIQTGPSRHFPQFLDLIFFEILKNRGRMMDNHSYNHLRVALILPYSSANADALIVAILFFIKPGIDPFGSKSMILVSLVVFSPIFSKIYPPQWAKALTVSLQALQGYSQLLFPKQTLFPSLWKVNTATSSRSETIAAPSVCIWNTVNSGCLYSTSNSLIRSETFLIKAESSKYFARTSRGRLIMTSALAIALSSFSSLLTMTGLSYTCSHYLVLSYSFRMVKNLVETAFRSASVGPFCIKDMLIVLLNFLSWTQINRKRGIIFQQSSQASNIHDKQPQMDVEIKISQQGIEP